MFTSTTFTISEKEMAVAQKWCKEHNKDCSLPEYRGAIGGGTGVQFWPSSLGYSVIIKCDCGASKDVTDYDCW